MITAINNGSRDVFNIYLVFSGQREFLMYHRRNGLLYGLLKDGARIDSLRRWSPAVGRGRARAGSSKLAGMVKHLLIVVDDYIDEREVGNESAPCVPAYDCASAKRFEVA